MAIKRRASGTPTTPRENWSLRYIELQDAYDRRIHEALREALESTEQAMRELERKTGIGGKVARAQMAGTRSALLEAMQQLFMVIGKIIREGQKDAAEEATRAFLLDEDALLDILFRDPVEKAVFKEAQILKARRNVQSMMTRILNTEQPLSRRLYKSEAFSKNLISNTINNHLARGSSAADMAKDLNDFVKPTKPGGVSYIAKRLARTEMNNAFHAQSIQDMQDQPWCDQVRWNLSKSHPPRQPEDACDYYAHVGLFPANDIPKKPHPNCLCYVTPELMDEDLFISNLRAGNFQSWMENNT